MNCVFAVCVCLLTIVFFFSFGPKMSERVLSRQKFSISSGWQLMASPLLIRIVIGNDYDYDYDSCIFELCSSQLASR